MIATGKGILSVEAAAKMSHPRWMEVGNTNTLLLQKDGVRQVLWDLIFQSANYQEITANDQDIRI